MIATRYPVTLRIIADGETMVDTDVDDAQMFRLPPGFTLSRDWEIELSGSHDIQSVQVATSPTELI